MTWSYGDWHEDMVALYDDDTDQMVCWLQKKGGVDAKALALIKAAPELLETLRFVLPVLERAARRGTIDAEGVNLELEAAREVQEAIAKAEGRSEW